MTFEVFLLIIGLILLYNKKLDWGLTLIVFLSMGYMGLGGSSSIIVSETIGRLNAAMILSVFFSYYCINQFPKQRNVDVRQQGIHSYMTGFFIYILFVILLDIAIRQTSLWDIFRTQRHWLFLLLWIPLKRVPSEILNKTIRHLYYFTIVISSIILLEGITGIYVFTHGYKDFSTSVELERGALSSMTAFLYIFMLYSGYKKVSKRVRYGLILLMVYIIAASAVRSAFIALGLGLLIMAYYQSANKARSMASIIGAGMLLMAVIYLSPALRTRLVETEQLSTAVKSGGEVEGSMSYRTQMVLERIAYISEDSEEFFFGVGCVPSDKFVEHAFLINPDSPLDSGDISWTSIVCRTGMVGTFFFIFLCVSVARYFYRNKRKSSYALPMAAYVTVWLFPLSFADYSLQFGQFWILPLIFMNMVVKDKYTDSVAMSLK